MHIHNQINPEKKGDGEWRGLISSVNLRLSVTVGSWKNPNQKQKTRNTQIEFGFSQMPKAIPLILRGRHQIYPLEPSLFLITAPVPNCYT